MEGLTGRLSHQNMLSQCVCLCVHKEKLVAGQDIVQHMKESSTPKVKDDEILASNFDFETYGVRPYHSVWNHEKKKRVSWTNLFFPKSIQ